MANRRFKPKLFWLAVAVVVLIVLAAKPLLTPSPKTRPVRFGAYTDIRYGFALSAPKGWNIAQVRRTKYLRELVLQPQNERFVSVRFMLLKKRAEHTPRRIAMNYLKQFEETSESYQVVSEKDTAFSRQPAHLIEAVVTDANQKSLWIRAAVFDGPKATALLVQQVSPASAEPKWRANMEEILHGFRWR
ncbi:MAG: hypothetical protein ACP5R4_05085 [Armatimonadota bacterium]